MTVGWNQSREQRPQAPHIGVVMPTWVGDACMATPTLRAIRQHFPASRITTFSRPVVAQVIDGAWGEAPAWVDEMVLISKRGSDATHSRLGLTRVCREMRLDIAVLLTNAFWSAAVMRLAGVPQIVGYNRDARGWLLTDRLPVPRRDGKLEPISAIDYYLDLAGALGCSIRDRSMRVQAAAEDRQRADRLWSELGFSANTPTLVINSNAATDNARIWPEDYVRELSLRVAVELGWQVLLHCGPKERDPANRIAAEANHPCIASMGRWEDLPIGLSKAVLERADLVLSTDSGPRHLAVALDRHVVTLFGPTAPAWTTTYNQPEILIQASPDQPSETSLLPAASVAHELGRSTDKITVAEVFAAVRRGIQRISAPARAA